MNNNNWPVSRRPPIGFYDYELTKEEYFRRLDGGETLYLPGPARTIFVPRYMSRCRLVNGETVHVMCRGVGTWSFETLELKLSLASGYGLAMGMINNDCICAARRQMYKFLFYMLHSILQRQQRLLYRKISNPSGLLRYQLTGRMPRIRVDSLAMVRDGLQAPD